jgi:hypothetical protein
MTPFLKMTVLGLTLAALAFGGATGASASTRWQSNHPRRAEVNQRLGHQSRRISTERRDGELSRGQARDLRAEDRGIRGQERFDASRHGGHITRGEQARLNHEENRVSRQIGA